MATAAQLGVGLLVVLCVLFVGVAGRTFVRSWRYREQLKGELFAAVGLKVADAEAATGDLVFFTAAAHPFHNSWVNRTLFTHVGVVVRGRDLAEAGVGGGPLYAPGEVDPDEVYVAECAEGITLADPDGRRARLPGGSYLVPLAPRLHGYGGIVYWARRAEGARLPGRARAEIARRAAEAAGEPYPGIGAMAFAALVGVSLSPHRQCYQHAAHVLNACDGDWAEGFFESPAPLDVAARGDDPRYERARIVQRVPRSGELAAAAASPTGGKRRVRFAL